MTHKKIGVLLINVGSPKTPELHDIDKYLKKFLMDPFVIDIPWIFRFLLVYLFIVPNRKIGSSLSYKKIWTSNGSPLQLNCQNLLLKLKNRINYPIALAMRYGSPSIKEGITQLKSYGVEKLLIFPLYPQYAKATSLTAIKEVLRHWNIKENVFYIPPFYENEKFIKAHAEIVNTVLSQHQDIEEILFSFHGLPLKHILKQTKSNDQCLKTDCCCSIMPSFYCYKAQCIATANKIITEIASPFFMKNFSIAFQSRVGKGKWIGPDLNVTLKNIRQKDKKRILVLCPSFTADCIETLEEVGMRAKNHFLSLGGEKFILASSLNSSEIWIEACEDLIKKAENYVSAFKINDQPKYS